MELPLPPLALVPTCSWFPACPYVLLLLSLWATWPWPDSSQWHAVTMETVTTGSTAMADSDPHLFALNPFSFLGEALPVFLTEGKLDAKGSRYSALSLANSTEVCGIFSKPIACRHNFI